MTEIYFVRHAQADNTVHEELIRPLTEIGRQSALAVTAYFAELPIACVYSSPYSRAVDTVKGAAAIHNLPVLPHTAFREREVGGIWLTDFPAFAHQQWSDPSYALKGGESLRAVQARTVPALLTLVKQHTGQTILIGTHATALSATIHAFDPNFTYNRYRTFADVLPWIVRFTFDGEALVRVKTISTEQLPAPAYTFTPER